MKPPSVRSFLFVWGALMLLLALTLGSAFIPLGVWNSVVNMGVAAAKGLLVTLFFMHLREPRALRRWIAAYALFTLCLLVSLSGSDYATRDIHPAPWNSPGVTRINR